ncbi:MAG: hypothetical protein D3910_11865, partial [Candidatus Electrothrix sp. ATG2]|nr:hypothetical protein [Candidatus Electrothrix sp. ATG2]
MRKPFVLALAVMLALFPALASATGKIRVCHKGKTITVSESAVQKHLNHGDTIGPCSQSEPEIPEPEEPEEPEVTEPNPNIGTRKVRICHKRKTITVSESAAQKYLNKGATIGPCSQSEPEIPEPEEPEEPEVTEPNPNI